jgi:hypothetical protein
MSSRMKGKLRSKSNGAAADVSHVIDVLLRVMSLDGREYRHIDRDTQKWPVCDGCGNPVRYTYREHDRFLCLWCLGTSGKKMRGEG